MARQCVAWHNRRDSEACGLTDSALIGFANTDPLHFRRTAVRAVVAQKLARHRLGYRRRREWSWGTTYRSRLGEVASRRVSGFSHRISFQAMGALGTRVTARNHAAAKTPTCFRRERADNSVRIGEDSSWPPIGRTHVGSVPSLRTTNSEGRRD